MDKKSQNFLEKYFATMNEKPKHNLIYADYFCADEVNADICAELIKNGIKTATCSLKYWYEVKKEPTPQIGNLQIVTKWDGTPTSIIETTSVKECRFCDVQAEFAASEGEGDRSLKWWRQAHHNFFTNEAKQENFIFHEEMILILEQFKVIFK